MIVLPLRFRQIDSRTLAFADEAGRMFVGTPAFLERYASGQLNEDDFRFLESAGLALDDFESLSTVAFLRTLSLRIARPRRLDYLIVVPTLRCNLDCSYCQVSRAHYSQTAYDWSPAILQSVLAYLDGLETDRLKVEFQGGEPLLRPDLVEAVVEFCRKRFSSTQFIICTNLSRLDARIEGLLDREDVFVSTSLDGPSEVHRANRTQTRDRTDKFFANLDRVLGRFGPSKVSALPTVNYVAPPDPRDLLQSYAARGLTSIYLRPISFHGFARKSHSEVRLEFDAWNAYYDHFIDELLRRNYCRQPMMEEYFLTLALSRLLSPGHDGHLDLRNPAYMGLDSLVVDYDGTLYPTDEARMLSRAGLIDLSVGHVARGVDAGKVKGLNSNAANNLDPDCIHCIYQPACGADPLDDIARYSRVDLPRMSTFFCQRQLKVFDTAMRLLTQSNLETRRSLEHWLGLPALETDLLRRHHDSACH